MSESKLNGIIAQSLESVRSMVDANTIIGDPIQTESGTTIIPVSKISVGVATGGLDFAGKQKQEKDDNNFGGGGGTGLTVVPVAFLVIHADGSVEMMNVSNPTGRAADLGYNVSSLVDRVPEIIEKIKSIFKKKKNDDSADRSVDADEEPIDEEFSVDADEEA